jgi:hypothetical protein
MQELCVIGCTLSPSEAPAQERRAAELARQAIRRSREEDRIDVWFSPGFDDAVLRDFIATESACCSFFGIDWEPAERRLSISAPAENRPALDAIAGLLGA